MIQLKSKLNVALVAMTILWTSCQKETSNPTQIEQPEQTGKAMGADAVDLVALNNVPLIISTDFGQEKESDATIAARRVKPPTSTADATAPVVSIPSPTSGATVSGTVAIQVSASDNVGVTSVVLTINGAQVAAFAAAPFSYSWNTTNLANANYTITATAKDAAGNTKSASNVVSKNTVIVVTPPPTTLPTSFTLAMPPVVNQGSEGACIAFAVAYARSYEAFKATNATAYSTSANILSPEYLFNQTKSSTTCSGSALLTSLNFVRDNGICTWASMPYTWTGCSLMPTAAQTTEAGKYRISSYSQIYASDITAIKTMIAAKRPLVSQYSVDNQFYNATAGFIWKTFSGVVGSHALVICGYDDSKNAFKVINQWGTSWGDAGYSWIDYSLLKSVSSNLFVMNL